MARAIGIDFGAKRTGIAVTDPLRISVNPLASLLTSELDEFLHQYLVKENVDLVVLGDPFHKDGTPTNLHSAIHRFGEKLSNNYPQVDIRYYDERNTSRSAVDLLIQKGTPKFKRNKAAIDQMSAILILQKYLNHF